MVSRKLKIFLLFIFKVYFNEIRIIDIYNSYYEKNIGFGFGDYIYWMGIY